MNFLSEALNRLLSAVDVIHFSRMHWKCRNGFVVIFRRVTTNGAVILTKAGTFELTEALFLRLLGLVYVCAFGSLWPQILGLIGSHGIAPAAQALTALKAESGRLAWWSLPTLFWWLQRDWALTAFCMAGCVCGGLLILGLWARWAATGSFVLYLSLVSIGQPFTGFQWDALLLETGFAAIFAGAPWLVWCYRFLLFRLMVESGAVKLLSHDPNWRNLHALRFHFMTQPLPTPAAFYMHRAPGWLLDSLTGATLGIELLAPLLLFTGSRLRYCGVVLLVALQISILVTGNYAFFNLLTLALCLWGCDDAAFTALDGFLSKRVPGSNRPRAKLGVAGLNLAVVALIVLGVLQLAGQLLPGAIGRRVGQPEMVEALEIVNGYGLFAVMTTARAEIAIEGSDDLRDWREYSFPYKPGELHRGLPLVAPHQPRLDWQMWFAALGNSQDSPWVTGLIYRLLQGDKQVMSLMSIAPFAKPPRYMRALIYDYRFTTPEERRKTGAVWRRDLRGTWLGPLSLKE